MNIWVNCIEWQSLLKSKNFNRISLDDRYKLIASYKNVQYRDLNIVGYRQI